MDYAAAIRLVYEHIEQDQVDKAVMACLRIARHISDYLFVAIFMRELGADKRELSSVLLRDTKHLKKEAQKFLLDLSGKYWLETHTLDYALGVDADGEDLNVLRAGIGELDADLEQCIQSLQDMAVPQGMGEFDTAYFTDQYANHKAQLRLRIRALQGIRQRIRTRCLNYAIQIEKDLQAQKKSRSFLEQVQTEVNNYFKAHCDDVLFKLQKCSQMVDSTDPENWSLLLTEVRRAIKAAADYLYPAMPKPVVCSDGHERLLGDEQYMNRLHEYIAERFGKSSSAKLIAAEGELLSAFVRRLNDVASKGVHSEVSANEAKQGLLGLYMFLFNVTSRLQEKSS